MVLTSELMKAFSIDEKANISGPLSRELSDEYSLEGSLPWPARKIALRLIKQVLQFSTEFFEWGSKNTLKKNTKFGVFSPASPFHLPYA